jgi:hypothetical protein
LAVWMLFSSFHFLPHLARDTKPLIRLTTQTHITRFMHNDSIQPIKKDQVHQAQVFQPFE